MICAKQNKTPARFFCDSGVRDAANFLKRASMAFESPLKMVSKPHLFAHSDTVALDLPFDEAIRYFRDKANVTTRHWYDVYGAASSRAFWVAGAATSALVEDFRQAIDKAISEGTTLAEFRKDFDNIVARNGWRGWKGEESAAGRAWRTRLIYETNLRTAYSAGRFAALTKPETLKVFPYWQYHHSGSNHPRLEHLAWDGLVLRADDPFWTTNYPPNGWHCGCYVTPVSVDDLKRQGKNGPDVSPELLPIAQDVGGKRVIVPKGVDAGFEYNPGREWLARTAPGKETIAAAPGLLQRFAEAALKETLIPQAYMPAAIANARLAKIFNVREKSEVRLSAATIQQHKHHIEATAEIYSSIIEHAISEGEFLKNRNGRISAFVYFGGEYWQVGLKKTRFDELFITTFHRTTPEKFKKAKRNSEKMG